MAAVLPLLAAIAEAYLRLGNLETCRQYLEPATQKDGKGEAVSGEHLQRIGSALQQPESAA